MKIVVTMFAVLFSFNIAANDFACNVYEADLAQNLDDINYLVALYDNTDYLDSEEIELLEYSKESLGEMLEGADRYLENCEREESEKNLLSNISTGIAVVREAYNAGRAAERAVRAAHERNVNAMRNDPSHRRRMEEMQNNRRGGVPGRQM